MNREWEAHVSELTFEEALKELEAIVSRLESNDLPLNEAIQLFKRGISLSAHCNAKLEKAEGMVKLVTQNQGKLEEVPFTLLEGDEV
jgi:exodeoxyribonuclease VII small subunit